MNKAALTASLKTASWLLWCDIKILLKDWHNNVLDSLFWPLVLILSNGYVLPSMGMPASYGAFITVSMVVIMASFTAWSAANVLAADLESNRAIGYEITLPLPYWLVFGKTAVHFGVKAAIFNLIALLVGKLVLLDGFSFAQFSLGKFVFTYLLSCLFFGTFALWAALLAGNVSRFMHLELRIAGPLFFICGHSFSWYTLHTISPIMGKLMLLTPWIYAYEGLRSAILGPHEYLNYWICCSMLLFFTVLYGSWGLRLFKKQLDCV
jgi:hypothetical protein